MKKGKRLKQLFHKLNQNGNQSNFHTSSITHTKINAFTVDGQGQSAPSTRAEEADDFRSVFAPVAMNFSDATDTVIDFVNIIIFHLERRKQIHVQLDYVRSFDHESLILLLCVMIEFKTQGIGFKASMPLNEQANEFVRQSIFYNYLFKDADVSHRYSFCTYLNSGYLSQYDTQGNKLVDPEASSLLIEKASKSIWGTPRVCPGIQRSLIEMMQNTNNHAHHSYKGHHRFWISVTHFEKENVVKFVFLDFGIGIFGSLNNIPAGKRLSRWKEKIENRHSYDNNAQLLKLIMDGDIHKTVTGKPNRGKGLPGIKEAFDRQQIQKLKIVTNNVKASIYRDSYTALQNNLHGTIISWQIDSNTLTKVQ